jgi:hypothetical protein
MRTKFNQRTGSSRTIFFTGYSRAHLDTTTNIRGSAKRNAAFTLQHGAMLTPRQPEGCVPVVVSRCARYSLRRPLDMRHSPAVEPSFPLTLTRSLGERERPPRSACFAHTDLANSVAWMAKRRGPILPLPWGEFLFSAPTGLAAGARDLSRRNVSTAQTRPQNSKASFAHQHPCGLKSALRRSRGDHAKHVQRPSFVFLAE